MRFVAKTSFAYCGPNGMELISGNDFVIDNINVEYVGVIAYVCAP